MSRRGKVQGAVVRLRLYSPEANTTVDMSTLSLDDLFLYCYSNALDIICLPLKSRVKQLDFWMTFGLLKFRADILGSQRMSPDD